MNNAIVYGNNSNLKSISQRLLKLADMLDASAQIALEHDDGRGLFVAFGLLEAAAEHVLAWGENLPQKGLALADRPDTLEEIASHAVDRLNVFLEGAALAISKARHEGWQPGADGQAMIDSVKNIVAEVAGISLALEHAADVRYQAGRSKRPASELAIV